jgi:aminopeptidase N
MKKILVAVLLITYFNTLTAQNFTKRDKLQGGLRPERTCFDVQRYDLNIKVDIDQKTIVGYNDIAFKVVESTNRIQLDLFENMKVDSLVFEKKRLNYVRDEIAVFVALPYVLSKGAAATIRFYYSGQPIIAKNAPWDGGFVYSSDSNGKPFVGVAVQGTGASLWYPVKDSQSDEPDLGASVKVAVPTGLMDVSNGRFIGSEDLKNGFTRWDWEVKNPINTYSITINIADYAHIHDSLNDLDLDYYVLKENETRAKVHFEEVKAMMNCYQSKFGPYPFKDDGFKLVEAPYLGMEHQSAIAYGNKFLKGYSGFDMTQTGIGLTFDYITIHESAHEWFGNSITSKDIADMWIHEGFTQYAEIVFVECQLGYDKAMKYANGLRGNVENDKPIIGTYGVNKEGSGDMYPKGALLLNTLRHIVNNDDKWWKMILKYSETYRHKIIDTDTVIAFFNKESGMNLTSVFNQYLKYADIPTLELKRSKKGLEYRWRTNEPNFAMPIDVLIHDKKLRLDGTNDWKIMPEKINSDDEVSIMVDKFYINN